MLVEYLNFSDVLHNLQKLLHSGFALIKKSRVEQLQSQLLPYYAVTSITLN